MKKRLPSILLLLVLVSTTVHAEEESSRVEPNIYEKQEIKIGNPIRNGSDQKTKLPAEQHRLTFEKPNVSENHSLQEELFQSTSIEKNTITSKADQLHLFSEGDKEISKQQVEERESNRSSIMPMLMSIAVIIVLAAIFVLIIPRLKQMSH